MNDKELDNLLKMVEDLISKVKGTPWVKETEIQQIEQLICKYREDRVCEQQDVLSSMREDMYKLYNRSNDKMRSLEKYTPAWENERRKRDMYFKFLNIPILFMIGIRDDTFSPENDSRGAV